MGSEVKVLHCESFRVSLSLVQSELCVKVFFVVDAVLCVCVFVVVFSSGQKDTAEKLQLSMMK